MTEQEEMVYRINPITKQWTLRTYPQLIDELMFQLFVQGETIEGNLLDILIKAINYYEYKLKIY